MPTQEDYEKAVREIYLRFEKDYNNAEDIRLDNNSGFIAGECHRY